MDLLDMSATTTRGNRYVLVMVDCFTRWTEAFPLPDKTAQSVADAFFNQIVCRFGMPSVIHSDQGREFENKIMQELCLLGGSHKTRTTPYHPESDGMVERFNRTLLMMLAMFAGKNRDDWDDLLPAVMMAYRSSVHASTGFSPCRLMFGEECTLPMDIGLPTEQLETTEEITSPYAIWVRDALEEAYEQVRLHSGQAVQRQKRLYDRRAVKRNFTVGDWVMRYYAPAKKCKLDSAWIGPYLVLTFMGWTIGIQKDPDSPIVMVHCQDAKKIPAPRGAVSGFGMPSVIHSDQGREFENKIMQELCLLGGSHKTRTTPYHPESDGMVERFNRTLLMMLAMFAGKNRDDWDDLLPAVMMAYRSSVHASTGFSPCRLMFGEECTLPMDIGLPTEQLETTEEITGPSRSGVLVDIKGSVNQAIGYSTGGQHNA